MSDLLSIGASSVRAYQTAMNVIGENIANASTKGYVRRGVDLSEISAGAGQYILNPTLQVGHGVLAGGVDRQWDALRANDVRTGTAEAGRTGTTITWLERVEKTLNGAGISASMTRFFNAGEAMAADPTGTAPRQAFLDAATGVAAAFTTTAQSLATISGDLEATARDAVAQLNNFAAGLAEANAGIARARPGSNEQAQLLDQRDKMLDEISSLASINVQLDDRGIATVRLNDANGPVLVQGPVTKPVTVAFNASGTMALTHDSYNNPQTLTLRGGSIAGFSEASTRVAGTRAQITTLAQSFAGQVNQFQANGLDLDGQPGAAIFDASTGDGTLMASPIGPRQVALARPWTVSTAATNTGSGALTAINVTGGSPLSSTRFSVSGGVLSAIDPVTNNVIGTASYTPGTPVTLAGLSVTVSGAVADGDSFTVNATRAGSRDNGNLQLLAALRTTGRFEGEANDMVTANASALSAKKQVADAQAVILEGALAARDAVSGVNLDQEAVDLMRFQQAYQASSRVIQVSRDIFESILQAIG
jgi:flagellar hook-associated protein 1